VYEATPSPLLNMPDTRRTPSRGCCGSVGRGGWVGEVTLGNYYYPKVTLAHLDLGACPEKGKLHLSAPHCTFDVIE